MEFSRKEFIVGVAIQLNNQDVFSCMAPKRHADVFRKMEEYGININHEKNICVQGFITSKGRFVTRHQAMLLVLNNKQWEGSFTPHKDRTELYSEDLW